MLLPRFYLQADHVDLVSSKTRKLCLHSYKPFNWDHRSTNLKLLSWSLFVVSILIHFYSYYFFQDKEENTDQMMARWSSIPSLKTVSHISNWPPYASRKMQKTLSRSQEKASNHVSRKNATAKSCFTKKYKYYSRFVKHTDTIITKMHF